MKERGLSKSLPNLLRLWHHFNHRRKRQFILLILLMMVSAFMDVISLGAILPFLGILTAPEQVFNYDAIKVFCRIFNFTSPEQLILPLSILFASTALISGMMRMFVLWLNTRLTAVIGSELSIDVYKRTLYQPYSVHVSRNSSEIISGIVAKVNVVVFGVLMPVMNLFSAVILMVAIISTLIFIDPLVASIAFVSFGIAYGLISWVSNVRLRKNGRCVADQQTQVIKALQEGLGGIRDVLIDGAQPLYCSIYSRADLPLRKAQAENAFIGLSPRYAMEAMGMVLITALAYILSSQDGGIARAFPLLGALALGAQRLLPALQQVYVNWVSIVGSNAQTVDVLDMLDQSLPDELEESNITSLSFQENIVFDNVSFQYTEKSPWVLNNLSFTIPKGAMVGFVGATGSGKSTLLDLLMGLLVPTKGNLLVDGQSVIGNQIKSWQKNIAHVPQSIYLTDATIAENIAFGIPKENIDFDRVKEAAHCAQISNFIENKHEGYDAYVGERGIRLSGGQRQRIGIARALYKQSNVLVFDEATSALDNETERATMKAIEKIEKNITICLIAHRLSTVKNCDIIFELKDGCLIAQGTYQELIDNSPSFRQAIQALPKE